MKKNKENNSKVKSHIIYKLKDGIRVPGVTTVINSVLAKPALIHWAWDLGTKNIDYRKFRDDKADIGSLTHYFILCHLKNEEPNTDDYTANQIDRAENSLLSFFEWEQNYPLEPILIEIPLVSERYKFGGTPDILAKINGDNCLVDVKTGKAIYLEYLYQLAAYKLLLEEHNYKVDSARILNIPRTEDESFLDKKVGNLEKEKEIFLHCLAIYNLRKQKRGKG